MRTRYKQGKVGPARNKLVYQRRIVARLRQAGATRNWRLNPAWFR